MRFFQVIFTFAIFGSIFVSGKGLKDGEEEGVKLIECFRKALDGGLEEAGIPNHNPLKIRDISFVQSLGELVSVSVNTSDWWWTGIPAFEIAQLDGVYSADENKITYNYSIVLPQQSIFGNVTVRTIILGHITEDHLTINIDITNWNLHGVFGLTLGEDQNISEFKVLAPANDVKVQVAGTVFGEEWDLTLLGDLSGKILTDLSTNPISVGIVGAIISPLFGGRLNNFWVIDHPARTDAVLNNCKA